MAEETSTSSLLGFCTVNCPSTASNYQLSHLRQLLGIEPQPKRWEARVLPLVATAVPEFEHCKTNFTLSSTTAHLATVQVRQINPLTLDES